MTTGAGFVRETVTATREVRYWRHSNHPLSFHYCSTYVLQLPHLPFLLH